MRPGLRFSLIENLFLYVNREPPTSATYRVTSLCWTLLLVAWWDVPSSFLVPNGIGLLRGHEKTTGWRSQHSARPMDSLKGTAVSSPLLLPVLYSLSSPLSVSSLSSLLSSLCLLSVSSPLLSPLLTVPSALFSLDHLSCLHRLCFHLLSLQCHPSPSPQCSVSLSILFTSDVSSVSLVISITLILIFSSLLLLMFSDKKVVYASL